MGDISSETSMEDILSSIKRIIAEEGEGSSTAPRGRKSIRPAHAAPRYDEVDDRDEVLELSEAAPLPPTEPAPRMTERSRTPEPTPTPAATPSAPAAEQILSDRAAEASRGALDALSRMVVKPEATGGNTLDSLVREMLRPMLSDWLDAKLPGIVEAMVAKEIARISARD